MAGDAKVPSAGAATTQDPGPLARAADAAEALAQEARARAARATVEAAADVATEAAAKVAHGVLDGLEALVFGKVGAAEQAAKADDGDPLARLRARYAADDAPKAAAPAPRAPTAAPLASAKVDPVARARAELDALKAARAAPRSADPPPTKKTL